MQTKLLVWPMKPPVKSNIKKLQGEGATQEVKGDAQQLKGDAKSAVKSGVNKAAERCK
jgi:uncharacterized protein YjbJ (UPF0337 family)